VRSDRSVPAQGGTSAPWTGLKTVIVHDWLTGSRGGEKVLDAISRLVPDAPILTLVSRPAGLTGILAQRTIRTSIVNYLPFAGTRYREYLPLFPAVIEQFDLDDVDLVISTSHCAAKAVVATGRAKHFCYCHSPMRYAWDQFPAYFGPARVGTVASALLRPVMGWLARWDASTAPRVTRFAANSRYVAGRIARYYNRQAAVLHPPVDTDFFTPGPPIQSRGTELRIAHGHARRAGRFALVVSALVPYKRLDVAIGAAAKAGWPLTIVGTGPDQARLRRLAGPDVTFVGHVDGETLRDLYRTASALMLPGEEDFGIAPVEALACGCPVVALARGGATETVEHGVTGILVNDLSADAFADALSEVERLPSTPASRRASAERFAAAKFDAGFTALVSEMLQSC
jgi:glycosyltransferase involved in cell wall biosynthesis